MNLEQRLDSIAKVCDISIHVERPWHIVSGDNYKWVVTVNGDITFKGESLSDLVVSAYNYVQRMEVR